MRDQARDQIQIKGLTVYVQIGVTEEERQVAQKLVIDLDLTLDLTWAGETDDLSETVDYSELAVRVRTLMEEKQFSLLERAAQFVCDQVLLDERVLSVEVLVRKFPGDLKPILDSVAVRLTRSAKEVSHGSHSS